MKTIYLNKIASQGIGLVKVIGMIALALNLVACAGNDYEENADRMDVITIGDSIFDLNGVIEDTLYSYAGQTFRNYTKSGAELSGGALATAIDMQYADAKSKDSNITTILMDGAGNDILIPATLFDPYGCRTQWYRWNISSRCVSLIEDQYVTAVNLLNQMAADGVDNVVWLGYYELPRGNANLTQALNYGDAYLEYACEVAGNANCQFVDPRGTIPASQVLSDNIHPTPEGSVNLANQIWPVLQPLL